MGRDFFRRICEARLLTFAHNDCTVHYTWLSLMNLVFRNVLEEGNVDSNLNGKFLNNHLNSIPNDVEDKSAQKLLADRFYRGLEGDEEEKMDRSGTVLIVKYVWSNFVQRSHFRDCA